jgi:hypothetical protein
VQEKDSKMEREGKGWREREIEVLEKDKVLYKFDSPMTIKIYSN